MKRLLVTIVLCSLISLFSCTATEPVHPVDKTEYEKGGIILQVPNRWINEVNVSDYLGFSEYEDNDMVSSLSVYVETWDFSEYVDWQMEHLDTLEYVKELKLTKMKIDNQEAFEIEYYNHSIDNDARCREIIIESGKNTVNIAFYSEDSKQHLYFNEVLDSISIKD